MRELFHDKAFVKYSVFIAFNAALLYGLYFVIKNLDVIASAIWDWLGAACSMLSFLFIGLALAYILSPLVKIINRGIVGKFFFKMPDNPIQLARRQNSSRFISILLTFLLLLLCLCAILYAFAVLIMGQFVFDDMTDVAAHVAGYFLNYNEVVNQWIQTLPNGQIAEKVLDIADGMVNWFSQFFNTATIIEFVRGIGISLFNLGLGLIVSIYLLKDERFFKGLWRKFLHLILPQKTHAMVTELLHDIDGVLSQFIRGALLDALIVAILSSIGLSLIGLDFAVFIGCFAGIANVIPYFGPILGMIPAFLVGTFAGGLWQGLLAVGILFIIQQIDCNIIYPKIVGATTGLNPLFVLLAVTIAGYYSGIFGMIIAVPIAGIIQVFVVKWVYWLDTRAS